MGAPINVWQPPLIESAVGKRVIVSEVVGPAEIAKSLEEQLVAMAPQDAGRALNLVAANKLQHTEAIRLVSATDQESSDIALSAAARSEGYDYVLRGEILPDRRPKHISSAGDRMAVSWRLSELGSEGSAGGMPVVVDKESVIDRYPDLALSANDTALLTTAAVRETYRLIAPSVDRQRIQLAIPYLLPGSKAVRQGNIAALQGKWEDAQRIWNEVAQQHPTQVAATHNLAIAAAAAQDFSAAKALARKAIRRQPSPLHKKTLVWIELRQRDYHRAFNLPDPPEGWFVTQ